jgi:fatty acid desaturase
MNFENYQKLINISKLKESDNLVASFVVISVLFSTLFFIAASAFAHGFFWFLAQVILGLNILQWFFLLHDLGHDHYFKFKFLNIFFGFVSSVFVILPFYPWRYIHRTHHFWTGYKDKDPTQSLLTQKEIPINRSKIINFCWKFWIPICTLSFSFSNFWNLEKLNKMFPDKKFKNYFSIFLPVVIHLTLLIFLGPFQFLKMWGLAYFIFLFICDPLLLSQHTGKKQMIALDEKVSMINFKDQDEYTRSLVFPKFIEKIILLGFNKHTLHHLIPTLPGYHLVDMDYVPEDAENWLTWLSMVKKTNGTELLYSENLNIKKLPINK